MAIIVPYRRLRRGPPRRLPAPRFLRRRRSPLPWLGRSFGFLALAGLIGAAAAFAPWSSADAPIDAKGAPALTGYARVVDGDTLRLNGARVRLIGIDAPELHQTCRDAKGGEWPCGRAARDRLAALLSAGSVTCAPRGRDRYGRTLAACAAGGVGDLGGAMVRAGYAVDYGGYLLAEAKARLGRRGLWAGDFERPQDWRRRHR